MIEPNEKNENYTFVHGHDKIFHSLHNKFKRDKLGHAIIISGKKGIGKSLIAKKFSEYLINFTNSTTSLPNNKTIKFTNLFYCEKKTNDKGKKNKFILIDDIRKLKKFFEMSSSNNSWRVAIIDSANDLNISASNALLKLIEEPPQKTLILLITHRLKKLSMTLKSRCEILKCDPLTKKDIDLILNKSDDNYYELLNENKKIILSLSNGSPGKAKKFLEYNIFNHYNTLILSFNLEFVFDREIIHNMLNDLLENKNNEDIFSLLKDIIVAFIYRLTIFFYRKELFFINKNEKELFLRLGKNKVNYDFLPDLYNIIEKNFENSKILNLNEKQTIFLALIDIEKKFQNAKLFNR